jgi:hypothetical protein
MSRNPNTSHIHHSVPAETESMPLLPLLALPVSATGAATDSKKQKSRTVFAPDAQKLQGQVDPNPLEWRTTKTVYRDCRLCYVRGCFMASESDDICISIWIAFKGTGAALVGIFRGILKTFETLVTYLNCFKEIGECFSALLRWLLSVLVAMWGLFVCVIQPLLACCKRISDLCTRSGSGAKTDNLKNPKPKPAVPKDSKPKPVTAV